MILYADASGLVKLFLAEDGSTEMSGAVDSADRVTSVAVAYIELRAALAAALRNRRLSRPSYAHLLTALEDFWRTIAEISVDNTLIRQAGDLAGRARLRAYDAMHLAALQTAGTSDDVIFACWDIDLRDAARRLGYGLVPA